MKNIIFLIPFHNEEKNLIKLVKMIKASSLKNNFKYKILFLNDCSTDNSSKIITDYVKINKESNILIHQNTNNLGHGKSLLKLFDLVEEYINSATEIVTLDSDMKIKSEDFNEIFLFNSSVFCKRKRLEEGIFRGVITLFAEFLVFTKTGKLWRDANCPFRLYRIEDFRLVSELIPKNLMTPNIVLTIILIKLKIPVVRKNIELIYDIKNSGVTWQGSNPFSKYVKLLQFSYNSFLEVWKLKFD